MGGQTVIRKCPLDKTIGYGQDRKLCAKAKDYHQLPRGRFVLILVAFALGRTGAERPFGGWWHDLRGKTS